MVPCPLSLPEQEAFFSPNFHCEKLVELQEVRSQECGGPWSLVPLEFVTLRVVHTELPAVSQIWFGFPSLVTPGPCVSQGGFCCKSVGILCIHLPLSPFRGAAVCPVTSLLLWI